MLMSAVETSCMLFKTRHLHLPHPSPAAGGSRKGVSVSWGKHLCCVNSSLLQQQTSVCIHVVLSAHSTCRKGMAKMSSWEGSGYPSYLIIHARIPWTCQAASERERPQSLSFPKISGEMPPLRPPISQELRSGCYSILPTHDADSE